MQKNQIFTENNREEANKPVNRKLVTDDVPAKLKISEPADRSQLGNGRDSLDPTRYGDWERKGRAVDF